MATLFNTKIKDTYQSLLKLEDNTILTTTSKNITDGLGNASPLYMSTTRIGIGTNAPANTLSVVGADSVNNLGVYGASGRLQIRGYLSATYGTLFESTTSGGALMPTTISASKILLLDGQVGINTTSTGAQLHIKGTGSTSATTSLLVQNSSANTLLQVLDNGLVYVGTGLTGLSFSGSNTQIFNNGGSGGRISFAMGGVSYIEIYQPINNGGGFTSGTLNNISTPFTYTNTSGAVSYNLLSISPGINNTGTYVGTIRGIYYNPSLTSLVGTTHIALETVTGDVLFGTTSGRVGIGTNSPKYLLANTDSTAPTGFQSHTAGSNSLYWKIGQGDKYAAVFENTAGYGDGVLIKVANNTHSGLLVTSNNATLLEVSDDVGGVYSPKITSGSRVAWLSGYVEHAGGVGTNIYGNGATPFITLREYSYHVGIGTTSPSARLTVVGGGSTSATSSLLVQNSGGSELLKVTDDGVVTGAALTSTGTLRAANNKFEVTSSGNQVIIKNPGTGNFFYIGPSNVCGVDSGFTAPTLTGGSLTIQTASGSFQGSNMSLSSFLASNTGTNYGLQIKSQYSNMGAGGPNYGKQVRFYDNLVNSAIQMDMTFAYVNPIINYTSTGNGQVVGFDFDPVVTSVTANTKVRAFQSSVGGAYINTTTYQASAVLQVDSTTQGVLFPRMTTAQKLAIVSPVGGLQVYDTTLNQMSYYNGSAWINF